MIVNVDEFQVASEFQKFACYASVTTLFGLSFILKAVIRVGFLVLIINLRQRIAGVMKQLKRYSWKAGLFMTILFNCAHSVTSGKFDRN